MVKGSGFSLVEVMVALAVFEVTLLGVVGGSLYALQLLRSAEARQSAVLRTGVLLDSLLSADSLFSGHGSDQRVDFHWETAHGKLTVLTVFPTGGQLDTLKLTVPAW